MPPTSPLTLVFVHGWSVTSADTYGQLPEALAQQARSLGLAIDVRHVFLGRYISFHDEVTMGDLVRAMDDALRDTLPRRGRSLLPFSCITHSTGGPVAREWVNTYYGARRLERCPMQHLVMLAPANHGSALAALGKQRVGRIRALFAGVEPGQRILDWLSLGSREQGALARAYLDYRSAESGFYPFVLTGASIDRKFYDFLNSYLAESGSDGVVRTAGANLNYSMARFVEAGDSRPANETFDRAKDVQALVLEGAVRRPEPSPFGIIPRASHSGTRMGIMAAVRSATSSNVVVGEILQCLKVQSIQAYKRRTAALHRLSSAQRRARHVMLVFSVIDDRGDPVSDFDLLLLGTDHDPNKLTRGFFVDRQRNAGSPNRLVYYVDYDKIVRNKLTGFRITARPTEGFAYYRSVELQSNAHDINAQLRPDETFYIEVVLTRRVDRQAFELIATNDPERSGSFSKAKPSGTEVKSKPS